MDGCSQQWQLPPEYVLEPSHAGTEFTLYRTRRRGDPMPLLAVAPAIDPPPPQSLRRLEHEYSLAAELEPAWAAKRFGAHASRKGGQSWFSPIRAASYSRLAFCPNRAKSSLSIWRIFCAWPLTWQRQARPCSPARGLIHKDIKPENVLADGAGQVWLTGFGLTSRLPRERQAPAPPEAVAGTLAYMSPEQTGRMNRSIDTRSDLYSLGITLYQMLTGVLPFAAADPLEWVHCHIARQPVAPTTWQ